MTTSLDITSVFRRAWRLYRRHWGVLLLHSLLVFAVPIALLALVSFGVLSALFALVAASLYVNGAFWYQALATQVVERASRGGDIGPVAQLTRASLRRLPVVLGAGVLVLLGVLLGLLLLVVPGLILFTWWAVAIPAAVAEGLRPLAALGRSRRLVRETKNGFEVFAVVASVWAMSGFLSGIVSYLAWALVAPFAALAGALTYFELRAIQAGGRSPAARLVTPATDGAWRPRPSLRR